MDVVGARVVEVGRPVEYFLCGGDQSVARDEFELAKAAVRKATVSRLKAANTLAQFTSELRTVSPVLVTGSSGYLGSALIQVLQSHDIDAVGIDLIGAPTTRFIGCVSDRQTLEKASTGCKSVIHTAALHAPNLDYYQNSEYERVNIQGTRNVIAVANELRFHAVVFSSTTSLMNTKEVKERERSEQVVLKATEDYGVPRNIYGVTKKAAEQLCFDDANVSVAVLRCSRFFVEDVYDTSAKQHERVVERSNGNVKANEMLLGTRASLDDMIMAHLVALVRITYRVGESGKRMRVCRQLGPLVVSSVSALLECRSSGSKPLSAAAPPWYQTLGWSLPSHMGRLYDSRETWDTLGWKPVWDFAGLEKELEGASAEAIIKGLY